MGAMTDENMLLLERYQLQNEIGKGGMGVVYLGVDTHNNEKVAVKRLKSDVMADDPGQLERFTREGHVLRQLNHPNIVKMLDAIEQDGSHYLVMEFVEGGSLLDVLNGTVRLSIQRVLYIALDLADALTRAHRLKILHRDIKPANILLATDGTPRLTDFGMARTGDSHITQEGAIVGTLAYLAPEAFSGLEVDERADIWAFGVVMYEMLAGRRPHDENTPGQLINAIMTHNIPPLEDLRPDIPTALVDLVERMLERDRHARIPSVRVIGAELEAIIRGGATTSVQYVKAADSTGRFATSEILTPIATTQLSALVPTHNLPTLPTPFVGRGDELDALDALLADDTNRLITILGPGGIGKTRLSIASAERNLSHYSDGVFFVPLAPIDSAEFLVPTIAEEIDFSFSGMNQQKELVDYLAEKQMLLVLDNFEHMVAGADLIAAIMQAAPGVKLLVSSRERLRLRGEHIFEISGMKLPQPDDDLQTILEYSAIKLFLQSAHRVAAHFEITAENAADVVRVGQMVQGLPLGIELAAAWLEMLTISEIAQEIENSLDFLETDLRDVPERHRSIRAVFEYSWNLMTDAERDTFMKLSIFRGGFEREAAQKVTGASLRTLTNLVNKSLIQRDLHGRYSLHKLLRQFAEEAFANHPDFDEVHRLHAEYYGQLLMKLAPILNTRKELAAIDQMEQELENLRIAVNWGIENELWDELRAVQHPLMLFYLARSMFAEGIELFTTIISELDKRGLNNMPLYWSATVRKAWLLSRTGAFSETMRLASGAHAYFDNQDTQAMPDANIENARALNMMAYAHMMQGNFEEAIRISKQNIEITDSKTSISDWFMAKGNLGYAEFLRGNYLEARRIYESVQSATNWSEYSPSGRAYGLNNLGEILRELGELDEAKALFTEAYEVFAQQNMRRGMAFTLNNLGGINQTRGDFDEAQRMYMRAYRLNRQIGDRTGIGHSLSALGNVASFQGRHEEAKRYFEDSLIVRREIGDKQGIAESLFDIAQCSMQMRDLETAMQNASESLQIFREIGDKNGIGTVLNGLAFTALMHGDFKTVRIYLAETEQLAEETGSSFMRAEVDGAYSLLALKEGDLDAFNNYGSRLMQRALDAQVKPLLTVSIAAVAMAKAANGEVERALELVGLIRKERGIMIEFLQDQLNEVYDDIVAELPEPIVTAALERGAALDLYQVVHTILQEV